VRVWPKSSKHGKPIFGRILNDIFHYTSLKTTALKPDLRKKDMTDT